MHFWAKGQHAVEISCSLWIVTLVSSWQWKHRSCQMEPEERLELKGWRSVCSLLSDDTDTSSDCPAVQMLVIRGMLAPLLTHVDVCLLVWFLLWFRMEVCHCLAWQWCRVVIRAGRSYQTESQCISSVGRCSCIIRRPSKPTSSVQRKHLSLTVLLLWILNVFSVRCEGFLWLV